MNIDLRMNILGVHLGKFQAILLNCPDLELEELREPYDDYLPAPYQQERLPWISPESCYLSDVVVMLSLMQSRHVQRDNGVSVLNAKEKLEILIFMLEELLRQGATLVPNRCSLLFEHLLGIFNTSECLLTYQQIVKLTRIFLEQGYDANTQLVLGGGFLVHFSAQYHLSGPNFVMLQKLFVRFGFDVESPIIFGMTPLMLGIYFTQYRSVKFLLDQGANIHQSIYKEVSHDYEMPGPLFLKEFKAWELIDTDLYRARLTNVEMMNRPKFDVSPKSHLLALKRLLIAELNLRHASYEPLALFAELAFIHCQRLINGENPDFNALVDDLLPSSHLKTALAHRFVGFRRQWQERLNRLSVQFHLQQQTKLSAVIIKLIKSYHGKEDLIPGLKEVERGVYFQRVGPIKDLTKPTHLLKLEHRFSCCQQRVKFKSSSVKLSRPD